MVYEILFKMKKKDILALFFIIKKISSLVSENIIYHLFFSFRIYGRWIYLLFIFLISIYFYFCISRIKNKKTHQILKFHYLVRFRTRIVESLIRNNNFTKFNN